MVRLEGFEPPTARFVAEYSIQLSYRRLLFRGRELCGNTDVLSMKINDLFIFLLKINNA